MVIVTPVRGRVGVGGLFALLGIACWVMAWSWLPPVTVVVSEAGYVPNWHADVDSVTLRWGAVAVALGGLALAARSWRAGTWLTVGLGAAWLGADAVLGASTPTTVGSLTAAVPVAIAATTLLVVAARRVPSGRRDGNSAHGLLFWSGVLVATLPDTLLYNLGYRAPVGPTWLVAAVAGASLALAVLLALAAGPPPVSRARPLVGGIVAGAIAVLAVFAVAHDDGPLVVALGMARVAGPLLAAALVALAGALPGGGRGVKAFVALLGIGLLIIWPLTLGGLFALSSSSVRGLGLTPHTASVVAGVFTGLFLLVGAGLMRHWAAATPTPAASAAEGADPGRAGWGWRPVVGSLLTAAGVAAWVAMALWVHPAMRQQWLPWGADGANSFAALGWDTRWAAIVLGAGGLRLLSNDRMGAFAGTVAWVCADLGLAYVTSSTGKATPWAVVAVAVVVLAGAAALGLRSRAASAPPVASAVAYSGISAGVAVLFISSSNGPVSDVESMLPAGALPVLLALSAALVVAAVLTAVAAHPAPGPGRVVTAVVVAVVGAVGVVGQSLWQLTLVDAATLVALPAGTLTVCALVLACAGLAGLLDRMRLIGRIGLIVAVGIAGPIVMIGALIVSFVPALLFFVVWPPLITPFTVDDAAIPFAVLGVLLGGGLAALALLPQAWQALKAAVKRRSAADSPGERTSDAGHDDPVQTPLPTLR